MTIFNNSQYTIDSISIKRIYSNVVFKHNTKLSPNTHEKFIFNKKNEIKGSIKGVNFVSFYINNKEYNSTWGHVSGWLSIEMDTIYVTNEYLEHLWLLNKK